MATGLSVATANSMLNAMCNATSYSLTNVYVQLHTADPGTAGTTSIATETTRKVASFSAASGGAITNDAGVTWDPISGSQTITYFTLWDAASSGNFVASGTVTAPPHTGGDTYTIPPGDLDLTLTVVS